MGPYGSSGLLNHAIGYASRRYHGITELHVQFQQLQCCILDKAVYRAAYL